MVDKLEGLIQAVALTEALVYCILGVDVRASILGSSGIRNEAQREFLVLVEDAIRKVKHFKKFSGFS